MAIRLSKERFESTPFGSLISWGIIENSPDGVYMTSECGPFHLLWSAWKGHGPDWAIYVIRYDAPEDWDCLIDGDLIDYCHDHGDKVHGKDLIARMVEADPEVLERYRR